MTTILFSLSSLLCILKDTSGNWRRMIDRDTGHSWAHEHSADNNWMCLQMYGGWNTYRWSGVVHVELQLNKIAWAHKIGYGWYSHVRNIIKMGDSSNGTYVALLYTWFALIYYVFHAPVIALSLALPVSISRSLSSICCLFVSISVSIRPSLSISLCVSSYYYFIPYSSALSWCVHL